MDFDFEEVPETKIGDSKMNQERNKQTNLIDTTDCLEAVSILRGWKNFLFTITILALLLTQAAFWLVNSGVVKNTDNTKDEPILVVDEKTNQDTANSSDEPNQPIKLSSEQTKHFPVLAQDIEFNHIAWIIKILNFVLILAAILYCLSTLFTLKISIVGRLGGINHICRALYLSMVFLVLLLPWQKIFGGVVAGAIYTPQELLNSLQNIKQASVFSQILHYLRFCVYWLIVIVLLILAQVRSSRWTKATLRRLEVI